MSSSPRITATIDDLTISEWIGYFPTVPELRENAEKPCRTDEEKQRDLDWHIALFEKVDFGSLICLMTYVIQVMKERDARGTLYLLGEMEQIIETEQMLDSFPPQLRAILEKLAKRMEN